MVVKLLMSLKGLTAKDEETEREYDAVPHIQPHEDAPPAYPKAGGRHP
jgi:hypothetical protein